MQRHAASSATGTNDVRRFEIVQALPRRSGVSKCWPFAERHGVLDVLQLEGRYLAPSAQARRAACGPSRFPHEVFCSTRGELEFAMVVQDWITARSSFRRLPDLDLPHRQITFHTETCMPKVATRC